MTAGTPEAVTRGPVALRSWAQAAAIAVLVAFIYHRAAREMWVVWTANETYGHGPLVPLVSLALAWSRRARLAACLRRGSAAGLGVVAAACAMFVAGQRSGVFALEEYSFGVLLVGLSLTFFGTAVTRVLAFPLAFLVFMFTFPPLVANQLSFALKEAAVAIATRTAELLGAQLERDGMTLYLATGELRVEHPCSGLRSLLALLAFATLLAGLLRGAAWRRVLTVAMAVPVAIVVNALRMALLILVAHYAGIAAASGPVHDVSGVLLYAAALAAMLAVRAALSPRAAPAPEGP
jgi:exosortase